MALVIDCHTRELLGWHLSRSGKSKTAQAALEQALITRFGCLGRVTTPFLLRTRNEAVTALKAGELKQWKKDSGYHQRSIAETAMYRFKQLIGPTLSLRNYNAQVGEILAGVKVMNKLIGLGMPVRQPVN